MGQLSFQQQRRINDDFERGDGIYLVQMDPTLLVVPCTRFLCIKFQGETPIKLKNNLIPSQIMNSTEQKRVVLFL